MSKFFKALEKIEQERDLAEASAPTVPSPRPAPVPAPPSSSRPAPLPAPPPSARPAPAPAAPPSARPAPAPAPPSSRPEPVPSPFTRPSIKPVTLEPPAPVAVAEASPTAPPVYGAPVARSARGRHAFAWQIEPDASGETGDIDDHLVSLLEPTSFAAEQYRAARLALETLHRERGTRVVGIASPGRGDGRTMTALNLAGALAQASQARVALVEADLRHPSVARYLGLSGGRGLCSYLLDTTRTVDDVLQRPTSVAFAVVPAGPASSMPYELLKSPRMAALLDELRQRYDYVLLDTPSALPFPDVGILRDLVDGFIVVVRANRTPREHLAQTLSVMGRPRTLGLVFNDDERAGDPAFEPAGSGSWRRLVPGPLGTTRG